MTKPIDMPGIITPEIARRSSRRQIDPVPDLWTAGHTGEGVATTAVLTAPDGPAFPIGKPLPDHVRKG